MIGRLYIAGLALGVAGCGLQLGPATSAANRVTPAIRAACAGLGSDAVTEAEFIFYESLRDDLGYSRFEAIQNVMGNCDQVLSAPQLYSLCIGCDYAIIDHLYR